jgi:hypothetical protein
MIVFVKVAVGVKVEMGSGISVAVGARVGVAVGLTASISWVGSVAVAVHALRMIISTTQKVNQVDNFIPNDDLIATSLYWGLVPIAIFILDESMPIFKGWDKREVFHESWMDKETLNGISS